MPYRLPLDTVQEYFWVGIRIPNQDEHLAAFWGALNSLGYWFTWGRDEAKTARFVSSLWRNIIDDAFNKQDGIYFSMSEAQELIKTQRMIVAALLSQNIDLTSPLPTNVEYSNVGITKHLADMKQKLTDIENKLDSSVSVSSLPDIAITGLDALNPNENLSKLDKLNKLDTIANRIAPSDKNLNDTLENGMGKLDETLSTAMIGLSGPYLQNLEYLINLEKINATLEVIAREIAKIDDRPSQGVGTAGEGEPPAEHETWPSYLAYKCKMANSIFDFVYETTKAFAVNDVDELSRFGLSTFSGAIVAVLAASGPAGWLGGLAGLAITATVTFVASGALVNFGDLATILQNNREAIIRGMYDSVSTEQARNNFLKNLSGGVSIVESGFVSFLLQNQVLNILFRNRTIPSDYTPNVECVEDTTSGCSPPAHVGALDIPQGMIVDDLIQTGSWTLESTQGNHPNVSIASDRLVQMSIYADYSESGWYTFINYDCNGNPQGETIRELPTDSASALNLTCAKFSCNTSGPSRTFTLYVTITETG